MKYKVLLPSSVTSPVGQCSTAFPSRKRPGLPLPPFDLEELGLEVLEEHWLRRVTTVQVHAPRHGEGRGPGASPCPIDPPPRSGAEQPSRTGSMDGSDPRGWGPACESTHGPRARTRPSGRGTLRCCPRRRTRRGALAIRRLERGGRGRRSLRDWNRSAAGAGTPGRRKAGHRRGARGPCALRTPGPASLESATVHHGFPVFVPRNLAAREARMKDSVGAVVIPATG